MGTSTEQKVRRPFSWWISLIVSCVFFALYYSMRYYAERAGVLKSPLLIWAVSAAVILIILAFVFRKNGYIKTLKEDAYYMSPVASMTRSAFILIAAVTAMILNIIKSRSLGTGRSFGGVLLAILAIALDSAVHEHIVRGFFTESLVTRIGKTAKGMVAVILLSAAFSYVLICLALYFYYGLRFSVMTAVIIGLIEFWLATSADIGDGYSPPDVTYMRKTAVTQRFLLYLAVYAGNGFFDLRTPVISEAAVWYYFGVIMVFSCVLRFRNSYMTSLSAAQSERVFSAYGNTFFVSKKQKKNEKGGEKKQRNYLMQKLWSEDFNSNSAVYLLIAIIVSTAITGIYSLLIWRFGLSTEIPFVRDAGVDILATQMSVTFLLTSFLSFLSARDDLVLWTDTMEYKLVSPKFFNFISLAIYSFTSLAVATVAYFVKYDVLVAVFFCIGILLLIILTFSMINIYFHRSGILSDLEKGFYSSSFEEQRKNIDDLYQHTYQVVENNDFSRVRDNFGFLAKAYLVYSDFLIDFEAKNIIGERARPEKRLDLFNKYAFYPVLQKILLSDSRDVSAEKREIDLTVSALRSEIIYFVNMLIRSNPRLLVKLLDENTSLIVDIDEVNRSVYRFLSDRDSDSYTALQMIDVAYGQLIETQFKRFETSAYMRALDFDSSDSNKNIEKLSDSKLEQLLTLSKRECCQSILDLSKNELAAIKDNAGLPRELRDHAAKWYESAVSVLQKITGDNTEAKPQQ